MKLDLPIIKFRGWDNVSNQMLPVEKIDFRENCISLNEGDNSLSDTFEMIDLMQYTGLKDVNGKEIYVGDIVKCTEIRGEELKEYVSAIEYDDCDLIVHESEMCDTCLSLFAPGIEKLPLTEIEVVGNIYESSELLEQI